MMLSKTYEALKAAGAPDDTAREAAEEIAGQQRDTTDLRTEMRTEFADARGELKLVKWMLGVNLAFSLTIMVILLRPLAT
jgi:hypothetical protein